MKFPLPLVEGTLIKRYKRFLADVELTNGDVVTAHCANSGSMLGLKEPGMKVWLSPTPPDSKAKLKYRWELIEFNDAWVGIHTSHPNQIAFEAIESGKIPELAGYEAMKREVKYGKNSRIDIFLTSENKPDCYVEVKNVHLKRDDFVEFPDAVTSRGTKHLLTLIDAIKKGYKSYLLFLRASAPYLQGVAVVESGPKGKSS